MEKFYLYNFIMLRIDINIKSICFKLIVCGVILFYNTIEGENFFMKELSECTILIVDDTEENLDILVEALSDDYGISVAMDGETALEILEMEMPDIILLDIIMPGMDGYDVCKKIKENKETADIPIIFLTAITEIESKSRGFELGAVDYITKPFEILEVKARVRTHLSLKLAKYELSEKNKILEEKTVELESCIQ